MNVIELPSLALASFTVTVALVASSSLIVPVPVSVDVTPEGASETDRPTVKVSVPSTTASSFVDTVNVLVSFAVPVKVSALVLAV